MLFYLFLLFYLVIILFFFGGGAVIAEHVCYIYQNLGLCPDKINIGYITSFSVSNHTH